MDDTALNADLLALERPDTLRHLVEKQLREAILAGRFKPGQRLIERELCEAMGVSRPSVREALRRLEAEKLVEMGPHRGPVVAAITIAEAHELYELRVLLESFAAKQFALKASDSAVGELRAAIALLRGSAAGAGQEALLKAKEKFYAVLLAGCGNSVIADVLRMLLSRINRLRSASLSHPGRLPESIAELEHLATCVAARDGAGAEQAAVTHVLNARKAALAVLEQAAADTNKGT